MSSDNHQNGLPSALRRKLLMGMAALPAAALLPKPAKQALVR